MALQDKKVADMRWAPTLDLVEFWKELTAACWSTPLVFTAKWRCVVVDVLLTKAVGETEVGKYRYSLQDRQGGRTAWTLEGVFFR